MGTRPATGALLRFGPWLSGALLGPVPSGGDPSGSTGRCARVRRLPTEIPRLGRDRLKRSVDPTHYLYGEATCSDGGKWREPDFDLLEKLEKIIPVPGRLLIDPVD